MLAPARHVDHYWPFDFAGTADSGSAELFDISQLAAGRHVITAEAALANGAKVAAGAAFYTSSNTASPSPTHRSTSIASSASSNPSTLNTNVSSNTTATAPTTTTNPASTSTTTPIPATAPDPAVTVGTSYPDADDTGVPPGTQLTVVSGGLTINTAGVVVSGKEIRGCVEVRSPNVTIKNTRILGIGCYAAVRNYSTGLTLSDVEITCGNTANTGVASTNFTIIKTDISGCENGLDVGDNVTMVDSWIHDLYYGSGAHTDGVQINQGAGSITFRHNTIRSPLPGGTAALNIWNEDDPQNQDVLVENNLLLGGGYNVYCPRQPANNIWIRNNRFGEWGYGPQDSCGVPNVTTFSGNVDNATGKAIS